MCSSCVYLLSAFSSGAIVAAAYGCPRSSQGTPAAPASDPSFLALLLLSSMIALILSEAPCICPQVLVERRSRQAIRRGRPFPMNLMRFPALHHTHVAALADVRRYGYAAHYPHRRARSHCHQGPTCPFTDAHRRAPLPHTDTPLPTKRVPSPEHRRLSPFGFRRSSSTAGERLTPSQRAASPQSLRLASDHCP